MTDLGDGRVKIEFDSGRENLLMILMFVAALFVIFPGLIYYFTHVGPIALVLAIFGVCVVIAGLWLRNQVQDYYLVDVNSGKLFVHRQFMGKTVQEEVLSLAESPGLGVDCKIVGLRNSQVPLYHVVLFTPEGRKLKLLNSVENFKSINRAAEKISRIMKVPFFPGQEIHGFDLVHRNGEWVPEYTFKF